MLVYLTPDDYYVNQFRELCNKITGYSFIFFTSNSCKYCKDIQPSFVQISQTIKGCVFGIMNVDQDNQKIVEISSRSKSPLEFVPYIVFYANGRPVAQYNHDEYNPSANFHSMKSFLLNQTSHKGSSASASNADHRDASDVIPAYSIGIPGNRDMVKRRKVCYIEYDQAYAKK